MNELALFAGAGGGILAGQLMGWRCVCAVELDEYARSILIARQNDGSLEPFPIWDDIRTFDGRLWRGSIDVVSGGFPCQDISCAGRGEGIEGKRSGLWFEMLRITQEIMPRYVFIENSPVLRTRGLEVVLQGLTDVGFDARWGIVSAADVGAPHLRKRMWIVANAIGEHIRELPGWQDGEERSEEPSESSYNGKKESMADTPWFQQRRQEQRAERKRIGTNGESIPDTKIEQMGLSRQSRKYEGLGKDWWQSEPDVGRVAHGVACRVDRLKAIGNGQVPAVAKLAWEILTD